MDVSQRIPTIAGLVLIVAAVLTLVSVGLSAGASSDKDPFERDEAAEFLTDVHDNEELLVAAGAVGIVNDGVFIIAAAVAFFILFRDRSPFLATLSMVAIGIAAGISLLVDISNILLTDIANDFVSSGGADGGDPAALELGRYVGMTTFAFVNLLFTAAGLGFLALGALLVWAPQGNVNPPRWIGWVAIIAGLSAWLAWLVVAAEPGFIFFPIQLIASLVFTLSLGIWLLRHGDLQPAPMRA